MMRIPRAPRMHPMIPLAKMLSCMKTSLPLRSEASQGVYSHYACSIVVLVDMGMTASVKNNNNNNNNTSLSAFPVLTCHIDIISMLIIAKIFWLFFCSPFPFVTHYAQCNYAGCPEGRPHQKFGRVSFCSLSFFFLHCGNKLQ